MVYIPFIGRLAIQEYLALVLSFVLVFLESLISIITLALPGPIIRIFYRGSRRLFNHLTPYSNRKIRNKKKAIVTHVAHASDFVELCALFGYRTEEHIVQTGDGYLLGVHRLGWKKGQENQRVNSGSGSIKKKVVYLHHGLMMNSEVWVCLTEAEKCLPFALVENGYDVWLGNNRGNKYSKKSMKYAPTDNRFWNFSMDQFAFFDIPDSIKYILSTTGQPSLSYIGFSQGTAQAFATLSIHPTLNDKVDVFIALAPAMSPKGLTSPIVNSLVKASPDVLFLTFGRRAILSSAVSWGAILYPPIFVNLLDTFLKFLFGWTGKNITHEQKLGAYPHLYSFTSTKSVVHWFQIIRNGNFQMYDDELQKPLAFSNREKYYKVAKFPTRNIKTPIVLVYGGSDSLVDIDVMLKELPAHTIAKEIPHYEHLDFLWASSVDTLVHPHVFEALDIYTDPEARRTIMNRTYRIPTIDARRLSIITDESEAYESTTSSSLPHTKAKKVSDNIAAAYRDAQDMSVAVGLRTSQQPGVSSRPEGRLGLGTKKSFSPSRQQAKRNPSTGSNSARKAASNLARKSSSPAPSASQLTTNTKTSRPEGWWSSDEAPAGNEEEQQSTLGLPAALRPVDPIPSDDFDSMHDNDKVTSTTTSLTAESDAASPAVTDGGRKKKGKRGE